MVTIEDEGSSTDITLLFKYRHVTILILSAPSTPFSTLKTELLSILRERYPNGIPDSSSIPPPNIPSTHSTNHVNHTPIPESILNVILGTPKDENDLTQGWKELKLRGGGGGGGMTDSPRSLGLKDGSLIAFRFYNDDDPMGSDNVEDDSFGVTLPDYDENDGEASMRHLDDKMDEDEDEEENEDEEDEDEDDGA